MDHGWDGGVHVSRSVGVCGLWEQRRMLNMCWRSQRNSRALIRTSLGGQLVNSVLRIGVLYLFTKECKLAPVPSEHWEPIHMGHSLTLRFAPQCNLPQSKAKQAGLMTRPTHSCFVHIWVWVWACVVTKGSFSAGATKSLQEVWRADELTRTIVGVPLKHFILKLHEMAKYQAPLIIIIRHLRPDTGKHFKAPPSDLITALGLLLKTLHPFISSDKSCLFYQFICSIYYLHFIFYFKYKYKHIFFKPGPL